jgi:hypothetical protein
MDWDFEEENSDYVAKDVFKRTLTNGKTSYYQERQPRVADDADTLAQARAGMWPPLFETKDVDTFNSTFDTTQDEKKDTNLETTTFTMPSGWTDDDGVEESEDSSEDDLRVDDLELQMTSMSTMMQTMMNQMAMLNASLKTEH